MRRLADTIGRFAPNCALCKSEPETALEHKHLDVDLACYFRDKELRVLILTFSQYHQTFCTMLCHKQFEEPVSDVHLPYYGAKRSNVKTAHILRPEMRLQVGNQILK